MLLSDLPGGGNQDACLMNSVVKGEEMERIQRNCSFGVIQGMKSYTSEYRR